MFVHLLSSQCITKQSSDSELSLIKTHFWYCSVAKQVFRHKEKYFCNNKAIAYLVSFTQQVSLPQMV